MWCILEPGAKTEKKGDIISGAKRATYVRTEKNNIPAKALKASVSS